MFIGSFIPTGFTLYFFFLLAYYILCVSYVKSLGKKMCRKISPTDFPQKLKFLIYVLRGKGILIFQTPPSSTTDTS